MNGDGKMTSSWNIAFGKDGVWAVTDYSNDCAYIFDSQDRLIRKFGLRGTGAGQFRHPRGVSFDANNDLYVADNCNNRILKFDLDGKYLIQFGQGVKLNNPTGIVVHNDKVFVADRNNHHVVVYHLNGQFSHVIGSRWLRNPNNITITANGQLLVADHDESCIFRFALDGTYLNRFGDGVLNGPTAVASDVCGCILVTDYNNRVSVFDKDGVLIHTFGSKGSAEGQFCSPRGIAIILNHEVYATDYGGKGVKIF